MLPSHDHADQHTSPWSLSKYLISYEGALQQVLGKTYIFFFLILLECTSILRLASWALHPTNILVKVARLPFPSPLLLSKTFLFWHNTSHAHNNTSHAHNNTSHAHYNKGYENQRKPFWLSTHRYTQIMGWVRFSHELWSMWTGPFVHFHSFFEVFLLICAFAFHFEGKARKWRKVMESEDLAESEKPQIYHPRVF